MSSGLFAKIPLAALVAAVAIALFAFSEDRAQAGVIGQGSVTLSVDTAVDHAGLHQPDSVLSLREAMNVARGALTYAMLMPLEQDNIVGAPGAASADTIIFDSSAFPLNATTPIPLVGSLPTMNTGSDAVVATGDAVNGTSNVWIQGPGGPCFQIVSNSNVIAGLQITNCGPAINNAGGDFNTIGGITPASRNTFFNTGAAVLLAFSADNNDVLGNVMNRHEQPAIQIDTSDSNEISGNMIGTDYTGEMDLGNGTGVLIVNGSLSNIVGGDTPAERNVISGNDFGEGAGVQIEDSNINTISGNYIGVNAAGDAALPNRIGILLTNTSNTTIGGPTEAERNVISGNSTAAITVIGAFTFVYNNYIGTDATGTVDIGNGRGVILHGDQLITHDNEIGEAGMGNVISGSGGNGNGAGVSVVAATRTQVHDNLIGTDASGAKPLGNDGPGIEVMDTVVTYIGGFIEDGGNTIAFNGGDGIAVTEFAVEPYRTYIAGNSIHSNDGLGIDLLDDGVTPNDDMDLDTGPNGLQNFPVLTSAQIPDMASQQGLPTLEVSGMLNSTPNVQFHIQFFANDECDPSGNGEGEEFIGTGTTLNTDAEGNVEFSFALFTPVAPGSSITAIADNQDADEMSEFSACIEVVAPATPTPTPSPTPSPTPTPGPKTPTPSATLAPTPSPTATATPPPTATPTGAPKRLQGDVDCDGDVDSVDALKQLRHVASLAVEQDPGCPEIASAALFGDVDCDEDVDSVDALFVLRFVAALPVNVPAECRPIGSS